MTEQHGSGTAAGGSPEAPATESPATESPAAETMAELARLRAELCTTARPLSDLWHERTPLWQALGWERAQLRLWLRCLPGVAMSGADTADPVFGSAAAAGRPGATAQTGLAAQQQLGERIAEVLTALGKPAPPALIRTRLPPDLLVTDALILGAARAHPRLALTGPLIRLK
jgi:hypothetical protein